MKAFVQNRYGSAEVLSGLPNTMRLLMCAMVISMISREARAAATFGAGRLALKMRDRAI